MTASPAGAATLRWLEAGGELVLIWLMVPVGVLLVGLPIVLVIRGLVELGEALFGG